MGPNHLSPQRRFEERGVLEVPAWWQLVEFLTDHPMVDHLKLYEDGSTDYLYGTTRTYLTQGSTVRSHSAMFSEWDSRVIIKLTIQVDISSQSWAMHQLETTLTSLGYPIQWKIVKMSSTWQFLTHQIENFTIWSQIWAKHLHLLSNFLEILIMFVRLCLLDRLLAPSTRTITSSKHIP